MTKNQEKEILDALSGISKDKGHWENEIGQVMLLLEGTSATIKAKALWLLGEMGYAYPQQVRPHVPAIAQLLSDEDCKIRERAIGALGRIGRGDYDAVEPYIDSMMEKSNDAAAPVRMNFIWAAENIATNHPEVFAGKVDVFAALLDDEAIRVRIEAPEIFRVIGKRLPALVLPYIEKLNYMSVHDEDRVVRIHSAGAVKATMDASQF